MGDPRKARKKFETPFHPWQSARIEEEGVLLKEYGLKNKSEIWKMRSAVKNFADQAKRLIAIGGEQAEKEKNLLLQKLNRMGLTGKSAKLEDVLSLTVRDIMDRRLQTIVFKKGLAKSISQARQFVVHRHITVKGSLVTTPSYVVLAEEEPSVSFIAKSSLADEEHPERVIEKKEKKAKKRAPKGARKEKKKEEKPAEKGKK
jgi:small subunit ribosomal protein S4